MAALDRVGVSPNPIDAPETVGDRVRRYRRARGLTQEQLAEKAEVDRRYLGKIETGDVLEPGAGTARKLANALGIPVRSLAEPLGWYDDENPAGTVDTMDEIERAILENPDLDDEQKNGLILSARLLVAPHIQEAHRRRQRKGERHSA